MLTGPYRNVYVLVRAWAVTGAASPIAAKATAARGNARRWSEGARPAAMPTGGQPSATGRRESSARTGGRLGAPPRSRLPAHVSTTGGAAPRPQRQRLGSAAARAADRRVRRVGVADGLQRAPRGGAGAADRARAHPA